MLARREDKTEDARRRMNEQEEIRVKSRRVEKGM